MDIEAYAEFKQFYSEEIPDLLLELLSSHQWQSLIDIGCGDGALLFALKRKGLLKDKLVSAVDLSAQRIERVKTLDSNYQCYVADVSSIPAPSKSCDLIISTQVIEHIPSELTMLQEMQRLLSQEGVVYLSTVYKKWYGWYFYRCNGMWVLDPTHLREYSQDRQLVDIIHASGFKVYASRKSLIMFPLVDFILRRLPVSYSRVFDNRWIAFIRKAIQIPILGYYNWELVLTRG